MNERPTHPTTAGVNGEATTNQTAGTAGSEKAKRPVPTFVHHTEHQGDILDNAKCIVAFLEDMAPCFSDDNPVTVLSKDGAHGLCLILHALKNTIKAASDLYDQGRTPAAWLHEEARQ